MYEQSQTLSISGRCRFLPTKGPFSDSSPVEKYLITLREGRRVLLSSPNWGLHQTLLNMGELSTSPPTEVFDVQQYFQS